MFLIHFHTINFIHVLRLVNAEVLVGYNPRGVGSAVAELVRKFYPSLIDSLAELNEFMGSEVLKFNEYVSLEHGS